MVYISQCEGFSLISSTTDLCYIEEDEAGSDEDLVVYISQ